jgi:ParB-like chromosome segregation protein Spo0J
MNVESSPDSPKSMRLGFEHKTRTISIESIIPTKILKPEIKLTIKYRQIVSSIEVVGVIEMPSVVPNCERPGTYFLLDGLLRVEALKDRGMTEVECLVATDDEAYTYNKRVNRITAVQEHKMIVRAIERGASEEQIAKALNVNPGSIRQRSRLLNGICQEASSLLEDKHCPLVIFELLKQMKPLRQMEAAELMVGQNNYTAGFARAILAATSDDQRVACSKTAITVGEITREQIVRLERELATIQQRTRCVEENYGADNLTLTVTKTYLTKLLNRPQIASWLNENRPDYLAEFQSIADISSLG